MMNSLYFLMLRSAKNSVLEVFRKPAKLILWIITILALAGTFVTMALTKQSMGQLADPIWLKGILFLLVCFFTYFAVQKGLSNGDVIFGMNDVNLLFVSPVSPRKILLYGIVRVAKMSFLVGFFILFQGSSLRKFGIDFGGILLIFLSFLLAVSLLQIISLLIYTLANGRPARKRVVRLICVAAFVPLAGYFCMQLAQTGNLMGALEQALRSPYFAWTPVAGWAAEGAVSMIFGNVTNGLLFFALILLAGAALILYIALSNPDYYEDVLVATETAFEKKRVLAEGQINTEAAAGKKVKVVRTGIGGFGASAIFSKHMRESFRANRLGFWGLSSILTVVGAAAFSFFARGGGILALLQILMWMQLFLIGTGRGLKELYSHYIYMIPESPFAKIVWSNWEVLIRVLGESLVIFTVAGAILGEHILLLAAAAAVYTLFSFLLIAVNYLSLRWTGADISAGLLVFLYMVAVIVILSPGLVAAIIVGSTVAVNGTLIGMCILAAWELAAALGCFALSKGVLHHCDMPVIKAGK